MEVYPHSYPHITHSYPIDISFIWKEYSIDNSHRIWSELSIHIPPISHSYEIPFLSIQFIEYTIHPEYQLISHQYPIHMKSHEYEINILSYYRLPIHFTFLWRGHSE